MQRGGRNAWGGGEGSASRSLGASTSPLQRRPDVAARTQSVRGPRTPVRGDPQPVRAATASPLQPPGVFSSSPALSVGEAAVGTSIDNGGRAPRTEYRPAAMSSMELKHQVAAASRRERHSIGARIDNLQSGAARLQRPLVAAPRPAAPSVATTPGAHSPVGERLSYDGAIALCRQYQRRSPSASSPTRRVRVERAPASGSFSSHDEFDTGVRLQLRSAETATLEHAFRQHGDGFALEVARLAGAMRDVVAALSAQDGRLDDTLFSQWSTNEVRRYTIDRLARGGGALVFNEFVRLYLVLRSSSLGALDETASSPARANRDEEVLRKIVAHQNDELSNMGMLESVVKRQHVEIVKRRALVGELRAEIAALQERAAQHESEKRELEAVLAKHRSVLIEMARSGALAGAALPAGAAQTSVAEDEGEAPTFSGLPTAANIARLAGLKTRVEQGETLAKSLMRFGVDGTLTKAQFVRGFCQLRNIREDDVQMCSILERLFGVFDEDRGGDIDEKEAIAGMHRLCAQDVDAAARVVFAMLDTDGGGSIDEGELRDYLEGAFVAMALQKVALGEDATEAKATALKMAKASAWQCFQVADADGGGDIDFEEFNTWFSNIGKPVEDSDDGDDAFDDDDDSESSDDDETGAMSVTQRSELKAAFDSFDADNSGSMSTHELGVLMRRMGYEPSDDELKKMLAEVDADGSGEIDFDEFIVLVKKVAKKKEEEIDDSDDDDAISDDQRAKLKAAFDSFDADNSGSMDTSELSVLMRRMGYEPSDDELKKVLAEVDADGSGEIDFDEFLVLVKKVAEKKEEESDGESAEEEA